MSRKNSDGFLQTNRILKERLSRQEGMHLLSAEEVEKIKQIVLETALDIVELCEELQIPYMLGGGSALGAVRHQGFIPWDDDIDINIPRANIDDLLDAIESRYPDKYEVEAPLCTPGYLSSFIQIHRRGTVFREYLAQDREHCGIKVDIFVIENTYNGYLRRLWHGCRVEAGLLLLSCYRMYAWRKEFLALAGQDAVARRTIRLKGMFGFCVAWCAKPLYRWVQNTMRRCRDASSKYVTIPSGRKHFFGELYERKSFMELQNFKFEGHDLHVTKSYDAYLTNLYGDYRVLPPEEKREHHCLYDIKFPGEYKGKKKLTKQETQSVLLDMLNQFVSFCEENGLRYYLVGGTLLGAVRHQGFIPWDDDIDVGMPRPDYDRFLELAKTKSVGPDFRVISGDEGTWSNPYCEMLHMRTILDRNSSRFIRNKCQNLHLFIDIFPQDGWPEADDSAKKLAKKMARMRYMVQCGRSKLFKGVSLRRILLKTPMVLLMRLVGYQRVIRRMNKIARTFAYDNSRYVGAITYGIYGPGERCLREEVTDFTKVEFEGKEYWAPGCYDSYLTRIYGDYMTLPPENKRKTHNMTVYLDTV